MDRRSWLWRRRSSEKSPGETESSASASSLSERFSDEQDILRGSPKSVQSPEVSSKDVQDDGNEKVKALNEKLSAAVLDVRAKEDLVKQHAKVAEEAVLGWEKAEKEIATLKSQLNSAADKNSSLEDRIGHLDNALKECVRQLRRVREEQEQRIQEALLQQSQKWESEKTDLELLVIELKAKLEAKAELSTSNDTELNLKLSSLEKEKSALKAELLARSEELQLRTVEKELSTRAAEAASKQHLESIKKVAKLEAECRRLQAAARRSSFSIELKRAPSSVCAESVTDCQSDCGDRLHCLDNETSCSDSWASALSTGLDQSKNEKHGATSLAAVDIGLMDDFLEMEKLAAVTQAGHEDSVRESTSKCGLEDARLKLSKLEEKVAKMTAEKADQERALDAAQRELRISRHQSKMAAEKSAESQRQLNLLNGEKHAAEMEVEALEAKRNELETRLESAHEEIVNLQDKARILEERIEAEKALTLELAAKYQHLDALETERKEMKLQLESAHSEVKKLDEKIIFLEREVAEEKAFSARLAARCHGMDAMEAKKTHAELDLEAANEKIRSLQEKISTLELQVEEEKASSAEFVSRYQEMEPLNVQKKEMESLLESANLEISKLNEKVSVLERMIQEEKALSAELQAKCDSSEIQEVEIKTLKENVSLLEKKLDSQKNLSAVYKAAMDASETQRSKLMSQIELGHKEAEALRGKLGLLEEQVLKERTLSSEFAAKFRSLEDELSRSTQEHRSRQPMINGDLQINQEEEIGHAAGKLADCQKTIASLSRQLKSLANFDDLLLEIKDDDSSSPGNNMDSNVKLFNSANYSEEFGCLAVT